MRHMTWFLTLVTVLVFYQHMPPNGPFYNEERAMGSFSNTNTVSCQFQYILHFWEKSFMRERTSLTNLINTPSLLQHFNHRNTKRVLWGTTAISAKELSLLILLSALIQRLSKVVIRWLLSYQLTPKTCDKVKGSNVLLLIEEHGWSVSVQKGTIQMLMLSQWVLKVVLVHSFRIKNPFLSACWDQT